MNRIDIDKLPVTFCEYDDVIKSLFINGVLEIEFIYKSDYENTKCLRDFVEVICEFLELDDKTRAKIVLIADELNNNAIEYGSSVDGINYLRVFVNKINNKIEFKMEVEDNGKGIKHKTALEMETLRAHKLKLGYFNHDSIRGRGLFLITVKIVDRLYFKNSKNGGLIVGIRTMLPLEH